MNLLCLGLNHKTASVDLREQLAFDEEAIRAGLSRLSCGGGMAAISEMAILSTCNRLEIYAVLDSPSFTPLENFLVETRGIPRDRLDAHLYRLEGLQAARHLFRVAAGLDSLVIGEPQILGQVTRALELARGQGAAGALLNRLFQSAIHAGKRARTETHISHNPASVSSLAATLAERVVRNLRAAQIVVLGAGEMAELAVEALRKRGAERILVVNRTLERARALAARWGAESATFERLEEALLRADILISSTGAPHTLIGVDMVAAVMKRRVERPLAMIDIAVPRDIDPDTRKVEGVSVYDIDALNQHLHHALAERRREVPHVESILAEELNDFAVYLRSLDILPLIADLSAYVESIRQAEVEKTLRRLPDLSPAERKRIEKMTQALVKKIFAPAYQRLRLEANGIQAPEYAAVVQALFNLNALEDKTANHAVSVEAPRPVTPVRVPAD